jgi:hypothetical protein
MGGMSGRFPLKILVLRLCMQPISELLQARLCLIEKNRMQPLAGIKDRTCRMIVILNTERPRCRIQ